MAYIDELKIIGQVLIAMLLGAIIGWDRERAKKPAGLRTHMFVTASAALFIILGAPLVGFFEGHLGAEIIRSDPTRIIHAIITGVSFLGAGTIIRSSPGRVSGLTTAASLLLCCAIGVAVSLSMYIVAVGIVVITIAALRLLIFIE